MQNLKRDGKLMDILGLKEISRVICNTDKSYLTLKLRKGETSYWLYLDSVPLSKEENKEVMELLFPTVVSNSFDAINANLNKAYEDNDRRDKIFTANKKITKGRPKGSKNK